MRVTRAKICGITGGEDAELAVEHGAWAIGMIRWAQCLPMLAGSILGGWLGALLGKRLSPRAIRWWTLLVTAATTLVFFIRAYR